MFSRSVRYIKYLPRPRFYLSQHSRSLKMADDASYTAFLTQANQDPKSGHEAEGHSTSQARSKFDPTTSPSNQEGFPASLRNISATYTSDTDSEFEPVFFNYASHELPSVDAFRKCLGPKGEQSDVQEMSVKQWDPRGQYGDVVSKVEEAGKGDAKVFRVEVGGARVEYYVITVGAEERSLVGVVAKAVES